MIHYAQLKAAAIKETFFQVMMFAENKTFSWGIFQVKTYPFRLEMWSDPHFIWDFEFEETHLLFWMEKWVVVANHEWP